MKFVAWLAGALAHMDGTAPPSIPEETPVILVHGIFSSGPEMERLANRIRSTGREVFTPTLRPASGKVTIEELAAQLLQYADRELPGRKFDLVGFSMGGLVSRYYVQRLGGIDRVGRFVTLSTPHQGTKTARMFRGPGYEEMRPGSEFLRDLDSDAEMLKRVGFTSLYTPLDTVIVPARSSVQSEAKNIKMWGLMHPSFVIEKRCIDAVVAEL